MYAYASNAQLAAFQAVVSQKAATDAERTLVLAVAPTAQVDTRRVASYLEHVEEMERLMVAMAKSMREELDPDGSPPR
jgi:hypothetical protein